MTTGKTHSRHFRLYLDGVNLSGDARTLGSVGETYEEVDVTGWSDGVKNYQPGRHGVSLMGFQAVFNNTASTGSFTELKAREEYIVSLHLGIKAAPVVGDPSFCCNLEQKNMVLAGSGPLLLNVDLIGPGQDQVATDTVTQADKVWGRALEVGTSREVTWNGTSVDDRGAASSAGGMGYIHILTTSSGNFALKIQDSANDSDWTDLITFSTTGGTAGVAEMEDVAGEVLRYIRAQGTRTAGTITCIIDFVRY